MEILFLLIAIIITVGMIYFIGRLFGSHKDVINSYKNSDTLVMIHGFFGFMMVMTIFITLCASNNTFWHIPYMFNK